MAAPFLRLLHAAACQLDEPLRGVGALPRDVVDLVATATLTAWERLIDAAVVHDVDAVLLTGDTFAADASSLAADVALRQGWDRLGERQIPLFITPGRLDPLSAWQEIPAIPDHVTIFDSPWDAAVELIERGRTKAVLLPVSAETDVAPPELAALHAARKAQVDQRPFVVGLLWDGDALSRAAAGSPARSSVYASLDLLACAADADAAQFPLTEGQIQRQAAPQGMTPSETGPRGATLIEVDDARRVTTRLLPLAAVRRERLVASIEFARDRDDLVDRLLGQLEDLPPIPGEQLRLIDWEFDGTPIAFERLKLDDAAAAEIADMLTQLTDQPGRLRAVHQALPCWQRDVDEALHGELWRDYLAMFDQRPPLTTEALHAVAVELRPQQAVAQAAWERCLQQLDPAAVARRARRYGRRWFSGV